MDDITADSCAISPAALYHKPYGFLVYTDMKLSNNLLKYGNRPNDAATRPQCRASAVSIMAY